MEINYEKPKPFPPILRDITPKEIARIDRLVEYWDRNPGALDAFVDAILHGVKGYVTAKERRQRQYDKAEYERIETKLKAEAEQAKADKENAT